MKRDIVKPVQSPPLRSASLYNHYPIAIPKVIYFCNKTLDHMEEASSPWKVLNPEYEIKLYDNTMCEEFLLNECSALHRDIFRYIVDGPIKADFWRICILYKYGGIYSDIDNVPFVQLDDFIEKDISFVTCSSYLKNQFKLNPNFIACTKNHIHLKRCMEWYIRKYVEKSKYSYWGWSVMKCFSEVIPLQNYREKQGVYLDSTGNLVQIIQECPGKNHYDAHNIYKNRRIFNNRSESWDSDTHSFK